MPDVQRIGIMSSSRTKGNNGFVEGLEVEESINIPARDFMLGEGCALGDSNRGIAGTTQEGAKTLSLDRMIIREV